jgi:pSer/pThr/pTyr-binding forkhead associated (FHA) protein
VGGPAQKRGRVSKTLPCAALDRVRASPSAPVLGYCELTSKRPNSEKGATRCDLTRTWRRVAFGRMVRLVISDNEGASTVVPLLRDEVTIGRKDGNTIRLTERNISRRHVQLIRVGGVYKLRDLDSYNGVLVNGRRVEGESDLNAGDQIQLGDYTIVVEEEAAASRTPPPPEPSVLSSRRPAVPARLVMLTQPALGAEFVLPTDRSARLGRSDEVDCPINHRSVSREHAEIKADGDSFLIEDLGSANGVTVNGRAVKTKELSSGDIIELGQVVFRYVGPGEHYFFDAGEASRYRGGAGGKKAANLRLGMLLGAAALAAVVFILLPAPDAQEEPVDPALNTPAGDAVHTSAGDNPAGLVDDGYDKAVLACRSAFAAGRFAEAAAHASMALKVRTGAPEATDCKKRSEAQSEEEQTYVRGKDALQKGDAETAYLEFARLTEASTFRARPEVAEATSQLARARLDEARSLLPSNRGDAARLAQSVMGLTGAAADSIAQAEQILSQARREPAASAPRASPARVKPEPVARQRPVAPVREPVARPTPVAAPTSGGASAMEIASSCLARGDNECVIHALDGKASTAQELGLLIETYRAIGDSRQAQKNMATYVKRFPTASRAEAYRRMIELQNQ